MRIIKYFLPLLSSLSFAQWLETTIVVGKKPADLVYNPTNHKVYCVNVLSHNISVIDGATNEVIDSIPVRYLPVGLCYNSNNNKIYTTYVGYGRRNHLAVIDGTTNQIITTIQKGEGGEALLYNPTNNKIYATNDEDNTITVICGERDSVIKTIRTGGWPNGLCYTPNNKIYCSNFGSDDITVIDAERDSAIKTIRVGDGPWRLVYNPRDNKVYTGNWNETTVSIIDCESDSVIATVNVGGRYPEGLCYNPLNNKVYCAHDNGVAVIDGATNRLITNVPAGLAPSTLIYNPINNKIYCANLFSDDVTVIDGASNQVITTIPVGRMPYHFAHNPIENRIYVANGYYQQNYPPESTVSVIRDVIGIKEYFSSKPVKLKTYPTISGDFINLSEGEEVRLYDVTGKLTANLTGKKKVFPRGIKSGVYFLRIKRKNGEFTQKLILR